MTEQQFGELMAWGEMGPMCSPAVTSYRHHILLRGLYHTGLALLELATDRQRDGQTELV